FVSQAKGAANVMVVLPEKEGLALDLSQCRFTGARGDGKGKFRDLRGIGLLLGPNTSGTVRDCQSNGNAAHGILVCGTADVRLEKTACSRNSYGVLFASGATGAVERCVCQGNRLAGITVLDGASPILRDNQCQKTESGPGIDVRGNARVRLERNVCTENADAGV